MKSIIVIAALTLLGIVTAMPKDSLAVDYKKWVTGQKMTADKGLFKFYRGWAHMRSLKKNKIYEFLMGCPEGFMVGCHCRGFGPPVLGGFRNDGTYLYKAQTCGCKYKPFHSYGWCFTGIDVVCKKLKSLNYS